MNGYLLDTNHAGAAMRDDPRLEQALRSRSGQTISIAMPSIGELWFMVFNSTRIVANTRKLENLLGALQIIPFDEAAARQFGRVQAELRQLGKPIPSIDAQIAAIALVNNLTVVTSDRHFDQVPGLSIENWLTL